VRKSRPLHTCPPPTIEYTQHWLLDHNYQVKVDGKLDPETIKAMEEMSVDYDPFILEECRKAGMK
jgi:hypothetical protein